MGRLKSSLRLWRGAAVFALFYKLAAVVVLMPLLFGSAALVMRWEGYSYLTQENIAAFLTDPRTLLIIAVNAAAAAVYLMTDVGAALFFLDQAAQGRASSPEQALRFAVKNTLRVLRPENILLIPVVAALIPLTLAAFAAVFFAAVSVPPPVLEHLQRMPAIPLAAAGAALLVTAAGMRWRYAAVCFTLEGCTFRQAREQAVRLGKGRCLRDLAAMAFLQAAQAALFVTLLLALTALADGLGGLIQRISGLEWPGACAVWMAIVLVLALTAALAVPAGAVCIGALCRRSRARAGEAGVYLPPPEPLRRTRRGRALRLGGAGVLLAGGLAVFLLVGAGALNPDVEYLHTVEITAHRGASALYPENTMAAFSGAQDLGADWIELDVRQCADGQLVVTHDANLRRTTGVNAYVWDMTYEQLAALDAGAGERIPLLEQVLAFAAESEIKLNIELKPAGHDTDLERAVVDAIHAAGLEDRCVVTSQSYRVLENVKDCDEDIATVYVMQFVYGNVGAMPAADHFSVDAVSVTRSLVSRVHNAGKQLFVWTVNTRRSIEKMIGLNVDNIITDDVDLAKQCVFEGRYSDMLEEYIDLLQ